MQVVIAFLFVQLIILNLKAVTDLFFRRLSPAAYAVNFFISHFAYLNSEITARRNKLINKKVPVYRLRFFCFGTQNLPSPVLVSRISNTFPSACESAQINPSLQKIKCIEFASMPLSNIKAAIFLARSRPSSLKLSECCRLNFTSL